MHDMLAYQGKNVVVTGAASGIGQAAARILSELGAEVYALDIGEVTIPVKQFIRTDLRSEGSITAAAKLVPDKFYAVYGVAGIPGPPFSNLDITMVNFVGHRHLTETLLPRMQDGGAVASVTSIAGIGWKNNLSSVSKLLATVGFDEARAWLEANPDINNGYVFSKQCIIAYAASRAGELAQRRIRINCLSPVATDTPMLRGLLQQYGQESMDMLVAPCGRHSTPDEVAEALIFLNSNMGRFVSGHNLIVDYGWQAAVDVRQKPNLFG